MQQTFESRSQLRVGLAGIFVCVVASSAPAQTERAVPQTITNSLGMKLVLIPAGEFEMGSPTSAVGQAPA